MTCSDNTCGTGIGSLILPGDPDNNSILTATPAFGGVEISWTLPSTNPQAVAYVKVFRGLTSSFNAALVIGTSGGDRFYDRFDWSMSIATPLYYWIQIVSVNGTIGQPIGPASAVPRRTIEEVIEQLTAQIDYGMLSVELKGTVDKAELYKQAQEAVNTAVDAEQISIRDALALVQQDVDGAFVLISNEVQARQSAGTAFASSLNTLAVSTSESLATVQTNLEASIDDVTGTVSSLYTAKLTANGLVGGFGLSNNGASVEAGFDVDTFWVGRTQANKRKPFIISNNEVFIDQAAINQLTFTKLRDESGSVIVENGKLKADYLKVSTASIDNLAVTNAKINDINASKINAGYISAARIQAGTINADMIISASATSFVQATNTMADDVWVSFPFYMNHDGYVSIIGVGLWGAYSGSSGDGKWGIGTSVGYDSTTPSNYQTQTTNWWDSAAPSIPAQMISGWFYTGWNRAWLIFKNSLATTAHTGKVAIFMSYR